MFPWQQSEFRVFISSWLRFLQKRLQFHLSISSQRNFCQFIWTSCFNMKPSSISLTFLFLQHIVFHKIAKFHLITLKWFSNCIIPGYFTNYTSLSLLILSSKTSFQSIKHETVISSLHSLSPRAHVTVKYYPRTDKGFSTSHYCPSCLNYGIIGNTSQHNLQRFNFLSNIQLSHWKPYIRCIINFPPVVYGTLDNIGNAINHLWNTILNKNLLHN